jgi:hypothetical protein
MVQDDWHIADKLTLNLGLRYDLITNAWANDSRVPPILEAGRPDDKDNIQPRLGFAYQLNDRMVLRGGVAKHYGDILTNLQMWTMGNETIPLEVSMTAGRTLRQPVQWPRPSTPAFARFCDVNNRPVPRAELERRRWPWRSRTAGILGRVQRQIGDVAAVEVDYVYNGSGTKRSSWTTST